MNKIPAHVKVTVKLYLLLLVLFFAFRLSLFLLNVDKLGECTAWEVVQSFIMGVRFDIVTIGFVIAIPTVFLSVFYLFSKKNRVFEKCYVAVLTVLFSVTFIICAADIPYFNQFFDRFNITAFEWIRSGDSSFVFKMVFEEPKYILMIIPVAAAVIVFVFFANKIFRDADTGRRGAVLPYCLFTILLWGLIFVGMRGRLNKKSPIMVGTAYFCNNALLNQLGLNPNFTLARSFLESIDPDNNEVRFMSDSEAITNVQSFLGGGHHDSPIARDVVYDGRANDYNVVLVIMEGMSYNKTSHGGNSRNLTPFLDSLMDKSLSFSNCYTSGTHTYCGIYSTLTSYPVIFRNMPLKRIPTPQYNGLAATLLEKGYSTAYFTTHDSQFDNVAGFLSANGIERIVSQSDYPANEVKTTLGVPDDFMFRFSIPVLNEMAERGRPFFAAMLTASDHGPYYVPDYFSPRSDELKYQITEYADYSLQTFMELASKQEWFDNTLFVFVADHGAFLDSYYSIPLSYFHTPLVFYKPNTILPAENHDVASQIDVFPTIMRLLQLDYVNNSFGVDLLNESRDYAYFMGDDKYGVINDEWLFINKPSEQQTGLYKYREKDPKNYVLEQQEQSEDMRKYAESCWQSSDYQINMKKTKIFIDK